MSDLRYEVIADPASEYYITGYLIYDNKSQKVLRTPSFPGYWYDHFEAETVCAELNRREAEKDPWNVN